MKSELFRINQYTDMVLAYLRMRSLDSDYVFKIYDLDEELIRQVIRKFSGEFIRKKINIDFEETHIKVLTDEKWLVFVLEQLVSNALLSILKKVMFIFMDVIQLYLSKIQE